MTFGSRQRRTRGVGHGRRPSARRVDSKRRQFLDRAAAILNVGTGEVELRMGGPRQLVARLNPLAPPALDDVRERLAALGAEPLGWYDAPRVPGEAVEAVSASDDYAAGAIYLQSPSSLLPVIALAPGAGQRVLDVCAAPGGKASHIAAVARNDVELWLNDVDPRRVARLKRVMAWQHARHHAVSCHPAQYMARELEPGFDRILVDAQCSGEGRIRLDRRDGAQYWSLQRVRTYGRLQQRMLVAAFRLLRPGGEIVYSTCTLAPEENEAPVDHLLRHFPAAVAPVDLPGVARAPAVRTWDGAHFSSDLGQAVRVPPGDGMEAFFVCRIVRC